MSMRYSALAEIIRRDSRYAYEAYEFMFTALRYAQKRSGRLPKRAEKEASKGEAPECHVTARQLLEGIRELALRDFGLMARTVFRCWGIQRTDDFGEIVFNLVEASLMSKTPEDTREDFHNIYDLDDALLRQYEIKVEELE